MNAVSTLIPETTDNSPQSKQAVVRSVLDAFNKAGNPERFDFFEDLGYLNVFQTKIVGADGRLEDFEPLLNTKVDLPRKSYSIGELLDSIVNQVATQRHVTIEIATVPTSLFVTASAMEEAVAEPARNVLMRAFETINGPRLAAHARPVRLVWDLMYDPTEKTFFFNVDNLEPETEPAKPSAK